jgi:ribonuclease HI
MSQYEDILRERALPFVGRLEQEGFKASLFGASNYLIKVSLVRDGQEHGPALIYYSPKRNAFTIKGHEMRTKNLFDTVERLFRESASLDAGEEALTGLHIYVDGSFIDESVGYGWVAYLDGQVLHEEYGPVPDPGTTRQVAGELEATRDALRWCQAEDLGAVHVHYDYKGIEQWATGAWRAKNPVTQAYAQFISECSVGVTWVKEEAHTGVSGNERADQLAKRGAKETQEDVEVDTALEPMDELRACTDGFLEHLRETLNDPPFYVAFDDFHNDQFARLNVMVGKKRQGIIDIYNTKNKSLEPRFHAFRDPLHRETLVNCWAQYTDPTPSQEENLLRQAEHYHAIYAPYREATGLDFLPLAEALEEAYATIEETDVSLDSDRFDFEVLERHLHDLQQKI